MKTPKSELIAQRVQREQAWMHARWLERMTYRQIAAAAALPVERGGLALTISPAGVKGMVAAHREAEGDLTLSRDERRERLADEIDMRVRAARRDLDDAYAGLARVEAEVAAADYSPAEEAAMLATVREKYQAVIERADRRLDAAQQREEKLHGLAAPVEAKIDLVHHDAVLEELNAALVAMGETPIEVTA